mmetsp:Transcript_40150/g.110562  ORF Transcript_40150/g.110562 Transcript_40150/m.110562 type:complete len:219 (-) Transcript_40150:45-701(-)
MRRCCRAARRRLQNRSSGARASCWSRRCQRVPRPPRTRRSCCTAGSLQASTPRAARPTRSSLCSPSLAATTWRRPRPPSARCPRGCRPTAASAGPTSTCTRTSPSTSAASSSQRSSSAPTWRASRPPTRRGRGPRGSRLWTRRRAAACTRSSWGCRATRQRRPRCATRARCGTWPPRCGSSGAPGGRRPRWRCSPCVGGEKCVRFLWFVVSIVLCTVS